MRVRGREGSRVTTFPVWVIVWNCEVGRGAWIGKGSKVLRSIWGHVTLRCSWTWRTYLIAIHDKPLYYNIHYMQTVSELCYWSICLFIYLVILRKAGTWDLGSFAAMLQCLHLDKCLLEPQNTRKLSKTKNNCLHAELGQILDGKIQKDQKNPSCHFWRAGRKAGYCACPLHSTPPKGWVNPLSPPSSLTPGHTPTLTPYKEPVPNPPTPRRERAREPVTCFHSPVLQQGPQ